MSPASRTRRTRPSWRRPRCASGTAECASRSLTLPHESCEQCFLDVEPILGLVPNPRLWPIYYFGRHLFPPVCRETMQEDRLGRRELHQVGVDRVALERVAPSLGFPFLTHGGPDVGVHDVRALDGFFGNFGDRDIGLRFGCFEPGPVGLEP